MSQPTKSDSYEYTYITVAADPTESTLMVDHIKNFVKQLNDGGEIVTATGVPGGVHYVIRRKVREL